MLTITDAAAQKVKEIAAGEAAVQGLPLRVIADEGCGGSLRYGFGFDVKKDGDTELEMAGLKIIVDMRSGRLLEGSVIDFRKDEGGEGFAISNPNAKSGGCGSGCGCSSESSGGGCGDGGCGCEEEPSSKGSCGGGSCCC